MAFSLASIIFCKGVASIEAEEALASSVFSDLMNNLS